MKTTQCHPAVPLPPKHFAILFEGAWLFTQAGTQIIATCPLITDSSFKHECDVGLWVDGVFKPLPGLSPMLEGSSYEVTYLTGFEVPTSSFDSLFREAAKHTPILYVPGSTSGSSPKLSPKVAMGYGDMGPGSVRTVTVPFPQKIVADGVLITAEIDGAKIGDEVAPVHGGKPRPVVTFIFIYEYCGDSATATVTGDLTMVQISETITADQSQPTPHLIFKVFPTGMSKGHSPMDDAAQKSHTVATFDTLRKTVPATSRAKDTGNSHLKLCDLSIYHGRGRMEFLYGISGLSPVELGLPNPEVEHGPDLASCAAGCMASGPGN